MKKLAFLVLGLTILIATSCVPDNLEQDAKVIDKDKIKPPGGN